MSISIKSRVSTIAATYLQHRQSVQGVTVAGLSAFVAWNTFAGLTRGNGGHRPEEEDDIAHHRGSKRKRRRGRKSGNLTAPRSYSKTSP